VCWEKNQNGALCDLFWLQKASSKQTYFEIGRDATDILFSRVLNSTLLSATRVESSILNLSLVRRQLEGGGFFISEKEVCHGVTASRRRLSFLRQEI
jgi:hypothetical protein